jgi:hypothetical protein
MGGYGSGRHGWNGTPKGIVEHCLPLDIIALNKRGFLKPWTSGSSTRGNNSFGWWVIENEGLKIKTNYTVTDQDGTKTPYAFTIDCQQTTLVHGGHRWWLTCPACLSRRGMLYLHHQALWKGFHCRDCHDLVHYRSRDSSYYKNPFYAIWRDAKNESPEALLRCEMWMYRIAMGKG